MYISGLGDAIKLLTDKGFLYIGDSPANFSLTGVEY